MIHGSVIAGQENTFRAHALFQGDEFQSGHVYFWALQYHYQHMSPQQPSYAIEESMQIYHCDRYANFVMM
jgi:hypothetical protein